MRKRKPAQKPISDKSEVDKKLTLEMEVLDDESEYDDDPEEDETRQEIEENFDEEWNLKSVSFELIEPVRNFVTFWNAPIVIFSF